MKMDEGFDRDLAAGVFNSVDYDQAQHEIQASLRLERACKSCRLALTAAWIAIAVAVGCLVMKVLS